VTKTNNEPEPKSATSTAVADKVERPLESRPPESRALESRPQPAGPLATGAIDVDDWAVVTTYPSFCRVSSTPEELIFDLGLNPQPMNPRLTKVSASQRIIMNHFTAKRLLVALSTGIQRHESAFSVLETDVRRRFRST
jgi:hypothetical protein